MARHDALDPTQRYGEHDEWDEWEPERVEDEDFGVSERDLIDPNLLRNQWQEKR